MVERQAEAAIDVGLDRMLRVAIARDVLPGRERGELGRRAVLVGAADEQHLVAASAGGSAHARRPAAASRRGCRDA